jgi:uncharacterized protein (TIGR02145 family)
MKKVLFILSGIVAFYSLSAQSFGKVRDIDRNEYVTVIIGKQEWMAENLKTTRFNDGTKIPITADNMEWCSKFTPVYSWYENNVTTYKDAYGALYNWYTVGTGKLCPAGWHVPTHEEWSELTDYLGGINIPGTPILLEGELKSIRTVPDDHPRWDSPNKGATNKSGFTALPGGHRSYLGIFNYLGKFGFWWTSTQANYPSYYAYYRGMRYDNSDVFMTSGNMRNGFSVRCVREVK